MRKRIAAGNWKMNKVFDEGLLLIKDLVEGIPATASEVILAAPFIHLQAAQAALIDSPNIKLAAQNCHAAPSGAFTGEISLPMLASVGVDYVLIGHSERRQYFNEDNALLAQKVKAALAHGIIPIFCCGESLSVRENDEHVTFVSQQLEESLFDLSSEDFSKIVLAYEPIWAIGTGVTASPQQAQDMHHAIRQRIAQQYDNSIAENTSILYGGSVKPANASELFSQTDVDGGLVGGASLKAADFIAIVNSLS